MTSHESGSGLRTPNESWDDPRLIRECLRGNQSAWSTLIDKYKNLIYSIPIRYYAIPEDAADIFQAVCLELFYSLGRLRNENSLRAWLITVTSHQALHWKRKHQHQTAKEMTDWEEDKLAEEVPVAPLVIEELEREQILREAIHRLSTRCRQLIHLLFYEHPPLPYRDVARRLGLALGSIGFIRGRCLNRLQRALDELGF